MGKYILQEIQTDGGTTALLPALDRATRPEIESAFYVTCGSAAISSVDVHTVAVFTYEGLFVPELTKTFKHDDEQDEIKYIIIEMQTDNNGNTAVLQDIKADENEADSVYHLKLSSAAVSNVPLHAVIMITNEGTYKQSKYYRHAVNTQE